jgi:hypothetical protein
MGMAAIGVHLIIEILCRLGERLDRTEIEIPTTSGAGPTPAPCTDQFV